MCKYLFTTWECSGSLKCLFHDLKDVWKSLGLVPHTILALMNSHQKAGNLLWGSGAEPNGPAPLDTYNKRNTHPSHPFLHPCNPVACDLFPVWFSPAPAFNIYLVKDPTSCVYSLIGPLAFPFLIWYVFLTHPRSPSLFFFLFFLLSSSLLSFFFSLTLRFFFILSLSGILLSGVASRY